MCDPLVKVAQWSYFEWALLTMKVGTFNLVNGHFRIGNWALLTMKVGTFDLVSGHFELGLVHKPPFIFNRFSYFLSFPKYLSI